MSRRTGAISVLWICGLSVCALWRPAAAGEAMAAGVQEAKSQLGDLEAARNALRGKGIKGGGQLRSCRPTKR